MSGNQALLVAHKILDFAVDIESRKYIDFIFDTPAELQANTKYWVGFSKSSSIVKFSYTFS